MSGAVSVTLGGMGERAKAHIASGRYSSMSEVVRAGLRALDREEEILNRIYRAKLAEALADDSPGVPLIEAFAEIRADFSDEA